MTRCDTTTATETRPIDSEGVWCDVRIGAPRGGPALFLDRDGVIVEETGYLSQVEDIAIVTGAPRLLRQRTSATFPSCL